MNGDDMEVIPRPVVPDGHVKRPVRCYHGHQQALRKRLGPWPLLDDLTPVDDLESLLASDATLVGSEQRMVAPFDASGPRCGSNGMKSEHSVVEDLWAGSCSQYRQPRESSQWLSGFNEEERRA